MQEPQLSKIQSNFDDLYKVSDRFFQMLKLFGNGKFNYLIKQF